MNEEEYKYFLAYIKAADLFIKINSFRAARLNLNRALIQLDEAIERQSKNESIDI